MASGITGVDVFVVREFKYGYTFPSGAPRDGEVIGAWVDEYEAKYEAARLQESSRIPHDYIKGYIFIDSESAPVRG